MRKRIASKLHLLSVREVQTADDGVARYCAGGGQPLGGEPARHSASRCLMRSWRGRSGRWPHRLPAAPGRPVHMRCGCTDRGRRRFHARPRRLPRRVGRYLFVGEKPRAGRAGAADQLGARSEGIERPTRRVAAQPRYRVQRTHHGVAAPLERRAGVGDELLRPGQRRQRRMLRNRASTRRLLALQLLHRVEQPPGACAKADAPPRHRVSFRHAVHRQRARGEPRLDLRDRVEACAIEDEVLVDVVGHARRRGGVPDATWTTRLRALTIVAPRP
jgi:hypothetical protein